MKNWMFPYCEIEYVNVYEYDYAITQVEPEQAIGDPVQQRTAWKAAPTLSATMTGKNRSFFVNRAMYYALHDIMHFAVFYRQGGSFYDNLQKDS
ncbi:MAG: hypothetical protein GX804_00325 [Lentisphaerae bacterium]|nr:hypothetical protein [Lentisphaerota bacterium]